MKNIKINFKIKPFKIKTDLGYYRGYKTKGDTTFVTIELNADQSKEDMIETMYHEFSHFVSEYAGGPLYMVNKTKECLKREEDFCYHMGTAGLKSFKRYIK